MEKQNPDNQTAKINNSVEDQSSQPPTKSNNLLIIALCLAIAVLIGISAYLFGVNQGKSGKKLSLSETSTAAIKEKESSITAIIQPSVTDTANMEPYSVDTGIENQKRYISPLKGISFLYLTKNSGLNETFLVKETDNKIYLYSSALPNPESGQFLEIFKKSKNETLADAVKKQFLAGKDESKCFVETGKNMGTGANKYPDNFVTADISYPQDAEFDLEKMAEKLNYCSPDYARTNGIRYFLEDKNHPDKFIFLSIGQYAIMANENRTWQSTIKFIN